MPSSAVLNSADIAAAGGALAGHTHAKADVGLGNVDNTSDANKPVSTAQQTALNLKANLVSPSFTTPALGAATATSLTINTGNNTTGLVLDTAAGGNPGDYLAIDFRQSSNTQGRISSVSEGGWPFGLAFFTAAAPNAPTEKMRILSNGNVGIGTTSPSTKLHVSGGGFLIAGSGETITGPTSFTSPGGVAGCLQASYDTTNNKAVIRSVEWGTAFRPLYFQGSEFRWSTGGGSVNERLLLNDTGHVTPAADNTQNFGASGTRWAQGHFGIVYTADGTVSTSDLRQKVLREGGGLTDAEYLAWSAVRAIVYRDKDAFERKGEAARLHVGYGWQEITAAFDAQGLDAARYGLWCEDPVLAPVAKTRPAKRQATDADGNPLTETVPVLDDAGAPVFEQVQATEAVEQPFEEVRIVDGAPVLVKGTRTVQQPLFDSVQVRNEAGVLLFEIVQEKDPATGVLLFDTVQATDPATGEPLFDTEVLIEQTQATEEVEEAFEEIRLVDGKPVQFNGVRIVQRPLYDSVQVVDEAGVPLFGDPDPETGEAAPIMADVPRMVDVTRTVETPRMVDVPRMIQTPRMGPAPLMASLPRMVAKAKTETVPVMEDYLEEYTEMEPTGETRGALRYQECAVMEAAWLRRELATLSGRVALLEGL